MKFKIKTNLTAGLVMGIFSVVMLLIMPTQVRLPMWDSGAPSPRIIPGICLVGILICSVILLIQSLVFHKEHIYEFDWNNEKHELVLIAVLVLFVIGTSAIGFVPAGILAFCFIQWYEGERKPFIYIYTILFVFFVYWLFLNVFHVSLPAGFLSFLK
ncbi:tripartite tricarboxylate transporter TctB family protein [[Clostridium] aminophilum]|uniref:tripartite tricarboxylate transporter TctB family protein n=1 Tax=[Clostridium] aminophilum TaxID=1526 RepID=UPI003F9E4AB8